MRRCPHCQGPNPEALPSCAHCGRALPPVERKPWLRWPELWAPEAAFWALKVLPAVLVLRWALGGLLTRGADPRLWRPWTFHLAHGLLLGALLAWRRKDGGRQGWGWVAAGLAGGALSTVLELSYLGGHVVSSWVFMAWDYLGYAPGPQWTYQNLQILRLGGLAIVLWTFKTALEQRAWKAFLELGFLGLALGLRAQVRGASLSLFNAGWAHWGLYALSAWLLLYTLAPRGLTLKAGRV